MVRVSQAGGALVVLLGLAVDFLAAAVLDTLGDFKYLEVICGGAMRALGTYGPSRASCVQA